MFCWQITALVGARGPKVATSIHHGVNLIFWKPVSDLTLECGRKGLNNNSLANSTQTGHNKL